MTITPKQRKIVAIVPVFIIAYLAITLLLFQLIVTPQVNKLTGNVVSTVNVSQSAPSICNFTLYEGENMVSFHCMSGFFPRDFMLDNLTDSYTSIFTYDPTDASDPWKSYNPNLPYWVYHDLIYIYEEKGYWLIMSQNSTYYLDGFLNSNNQAQLYAGWNLIGYPRENATTPQVAFSSLEPNYDLVLQYKRENNTWYYYAPGDPSSTLALIEPDVGYWIHLTSQDIWVFP